MLSPFIVGWISSCFHKSSPSQKMHNQTGFLGALFFFFLESYKNLVSVHLCMGTWVSRGT